ncbi:MAG: PQQ-dependent sugar dehydrogenase [Anaerolineales bacterium]
MLLLTLAGCGPTEPVGKPPNPNSLRWRQIHQNLTMPVDLETSPDDRLFAVERSGTIRQLLADDASPEAYLHLSDRISTEGGEQGLLGLAFHPDFIVNKFVFISYTDLDGFTVFARGQESAEGDRILRESLEIILTVEQPYTNHNGGHLTFGPDGMLYLGLGDGGSAGDPNDYAQSLQTLLGKILRVDVDGGEPYAVPTDNPFAGGELSRPEIWAYGLRNPWRFNFDPVSGDLYIADVGQFEREELNFEPAGSNGGLNYGWPFWEGGVAFQPGGPESVQPIYEYDHEQGCAITGGPVMYDPELPDWHGVVLFGDACSGRIWGLRQDREGVWRGGLLFDTDFRITTFGLDAQGRILLADYDDEDGAVHRLERR